MSKYIEQTGERIIAINNFHTKEDYIIYLKHLFAYEFAKQYLNENLLVLDVGCGEGYGASYISDTLRVMAVDVNKEIIKRARIKYANRSVNFMVYDGINLPFANESFDAIISFQVIEHVEDDKRFISEIYRILKNKGLFIITTPNKRNRLGFRQKPWNIFHKREYNFKELKTVLKRCFTNVEIKGISAENNIKKIELDRVKSYIYADIPFVTPLRRAMALLWHRLRIKISKEIANRNRFVENQLDFANQYKIESFFVSDKCIGDELDLLGICKKE